MVKFCSSGGKTKITINLFCIRSGDELLVQEEGFYNWKTNSFEEDPSLRCSLPSSSPPCCLTVTLSGAAKEAHEDCEGEYKSTGLISMGRPVKII